MAETNQALSADDQVARIFEWRRGFNTIHLIDLGIRLGLFRALAAQAPSDADDLASRTGLHAPYVRTWLWTACGMGLVDADADGRFSLAPFMDQILASPTHPRYLGGYVQLGTDVAAADFRVCEEAFRSGKVVPFQGRGEEFACRIAEATWGLQVATARKILPGLPGVKASLDAGGTVLEVGCGTGNFLLQAARAFPAARILGVDIDTDSLAIARERVAREGLDARIELVEGDVATAVPEGSADAVVMIEVLHEIAPSIRQHVVSGAARTLRTGGAMVIVDETYPSTLAEVRKPEFRFPLQTGIEELVWGNVLPDRAEQERLFREAGFRDPPDRTLIGEGFTVLTARR
ncbi:MAG: methyltransferase domain-containing protein [Betaproteobacteria bacterium]|nr:methyltransferase domain-containing protein [Betaproteobacteria bacterium]